MIEEIYRNIYRISVPLKGNPLKELNSYFIRGDESDLLIDTGFRVESCREALEEGLAQLGSDPARRDVYATHLHSDHSGMVDQFVGEGRKIYMPRIDLDFNRMWINGIGRTENADRVDRYVEEGFTSQMMEELRESSPSSIYVMPDWTIPALQEVDDGDTLRVGEYELKVIMVPGHTPGNSMLWEEKHGIMFSGDHILFDITPNITAWPGMEDSLGSYLSSLKRVYEYPVKITFPGHRHTGDYHERIKALLAHHDRRINEAYRVICDQPGLRAIDIAGRMTWKIRARNWEEFPLVQKFFAVGECMSHLDYLRLRGKITRQRGQAGCWIYSPAE